MDNQTGRSLEEAKIKPMVGDVNKVIEQHGNAYAMRMAESAACDVAMPEVEEKAFDDFHLYTINRKTTLLDRKAKQVGLIRASGVKASLVYVYDGAFINRNNYRGWTRESIRRKQSFETQSNPKIWIIQEIENTKDNGLGIADRP